MALNERQEKFCLAYHETNNATESAKRAGYSEKTAYAIGNNQLKKIEVQKRLRELANEHHSKNIASAEEVLDFLTKGMRGELTEEVVLQEGNRTKRIKPTDSIRCAELLGKRYGLFLDKVNVDGVLPVMVVDDIADE